MSFGNDAHLDIKLNDASSLQEFSTEVDKIPYKDENTNTAAGIRIARTQAFTTENGKYASEKLYPICSKNCCTCILLETII